MSADPKKSEEVWAEQHIILQYDRMAVTLLKYLVQTPSIVLRQPCVTRLHTLTHSLTEELFVKIIYTPLSHPLRVNFGMQSIRRKQRRGWTHARTMRAAMLQAKSSRKGQVPAWDQGPAPLDVASAGKP